MTNRSVSHAVLGALALMTLAAPHNACAQQTTSGSRRPFSPTETKDCQDFSAKFYALLPLGFDASRTNGRLPLTASAREVHTP